MAVGFLVSCGGSAVPIREDSPVAVNEGGELKVPGRFIHTVFFWLKEGTSEAETQQLVEDCRTLLGSIETVRFLETGFPAGTPRDVVDNSYGVGLVVHFDNKEGHDVYQDAPAHKDFIARNEAIWERVQVYDLLVASRD
jgi:hypothetical protein